MYRTPLRLLTAGAMTLLLAPAIAIAADADQKHSFRFTIVSDLDMEVAGQKQKIDAETTVQYSWSRAGGERTLSFDSIQVKANQDGKALINTVMNRSKVTNTKEGKTEDTLFDSAPEQLKTMLRDSFNTPLCKLQVDENGSEVKREVVGGPGAKSFIDNGMIANALLFHPPFMRGQKEWSAPVEMSMGNGGFAKGNLTYKVTGQQNGQHVQVSGRLTNESYKPPGNPLTIKNTNYQVAGEQLYDPAQREWISGKLKIDASFDMASGDTRLGGAKGTMALNFDELGDKGATEKK
jgi:hypothetical protein